MLWLQSGSGVSVGELKTYDIDREVVRLSIAYSADLPAYLLGLENLRGDANLAAIAYRSLRAVLLSSRLRSAMLLSSADQLLLRHSTRSVIECNTKMGTIERFIFKGLGR